MKHHPTRHTWTFVLLIGLLFIAVPALTQENQLPDTLTLSYDEGKGLFDSEEILNVTVKFDVTEFMRQKPDEYMDAVITFYRSPDDSVSYDIRLRSRGERRKELCSFPPIRLNFKDTKTIYGDIDSMTNIKMVTHCNSPSTYDEYVMKEYLLYKIYNMFTENSFRVRLMNIKYIDTGVRERFYSKYGFLIEPMDLLEERLGVFELENVKLRYTHLVPDELDRMAVFQYMIGNTDWQVITFHNIKLVKSVDEQLGIPIPYDFDYSGFVNTSYAVPAELFPIENVRQRFFMGACRPDSTYRRIVKEFVDNKDEIYDLIEGFELLDNKRAKQATHFLDGFFRLCEKYRIVNKFRMECEDK